MEVALTRHTREGFALVAEITFTAEEQWVIDANNLYEHVIIDRTPPWYLPALREARRAQEIAERAEEYYDWPWDVPPEPPEEWKLTVEQALREQVYAVTFDSAADLAAFEPRMMAAFQIFTSFLRNYGSRPTTVYRRF